jgi:3-deoxy-D-manno-octulosonate 8-phosphate phosphatase (KDO 8-P phosphatase)
MPKKKSLTGRLKNLKALLLDVDGVLTDATMWYVGDGRWARRFSLRDGYGIRKLVDNGFVVGIITASNSDDIKVRAEILKIEHFYFGSLDKISQFEKFLKKTGFKENEIAYVGDDEPDVPVMKRVGFAASVPGGIAPAKKAAHYVTRLAGGDGAVREICDLIYENATALAKAKSPGHGQ